MADKETRVGLYADLRSKIDRMDTLSFDDPHRVEKYGLSGSDKNVIHEKAMTPDELKEEHIKKNTLSISIDDLIKQNDDYTIALEKKELDRTYRSIKKKRRRLMDKRLKIAIYVIIVLLFIAAGIVVGLHLGGLI